MSEKCETGEKSGKARKIVSEFRKFIGLESFKVKRVDKV